MITTPIVHAGSAGSKWHLGRTLCGRPASWRTPLSPEAGAVTCPTCKRRLADGYRTHAEYKAANERDV
jgi:hypothetical protein